MKVTSRKGTIAYLLMVAGSFFVLAGPCQAESIWGSLWSIVRGTHGSHIVTKKLVTIHAKGNIWGVAFSPDGNHLAADSADSNVVHVWDWRHKRIIQTLPKGKGAWAAVSSPSVLYSPNGKFLVACHGVAMHDVVLNVWNAATGKLEKNIVEKQKQGGGGHCLGAAFTPNSRWLVIANGIGLGQHRFALYVYDTHDWQNTWGLQIYGFSPHSLALSPNGEFAALGGEQYRGSKPPQNQIKLINLDNHSIIRAIAPVFPRTITDKNKKNAMLTIEPSVYRLSWHSNGVQLAAGAKGAGSFGVKAVQVFDTQTGTVTSTVSAGGTTGTTIWALQYSPDGKYLVVSGLGDFIQIRDTKSQKIIEEIPGVANSIAFSRNGKYLAMSGNKRISIWRLK